MSRQSFADQMTQTSDLTQARAIVAFSPEAIVTVDERGLIQSFNPAAERMFGYAAHEVIGRNVSVLMPEPWCDAHDAYIARYLASGEARLVGKPGREVQARHRDGRLIDVELMVAEAPVAGDRLFLGFLRDISRRKEQERALLHAAGHDAVTGLANRATMTEWIHQALAEESRILLFYVSIDRFQSLNEVFGHAVGDCILREVGHRLGNACGRAARLAHIGGSAFAVMLHGSLPHALEFSRRIRAAFDEPLLVEQTKVVVRGSIGLACAPDHARDADELLRMGQVAMQAARDRQTPLAIYDEEMVTLQKEQVALAGELRTAIARGEVMLHFQPKMHLRKRRITGAEALVRWAHPDRGMVPPDLFIPMIEETDLIHDFTEWLLDEAARWARTWRDVGRDWSVAVNLAPRNLLEADLADRMAAALARHGVPPEAMVAEITERGFIADPDRALGTLQHLHDLGIAVSIDDFGTGYSSLAYLKDMPVSELKIDRSFIASMNSDAGSLTIVQAVIQMAHFLGMDVTAEGVEHEQDVQRLEMMDCDLVQGYFIAKPMPGSALLEFESGQAAGAEHPRS
ncbi:MAG: EAL domain-containing protein [Mariprofundaceae bacterium]